MPKHGYGKVGGAKSKVKSIKEGIQHFPMGIKGGHVGEVEGSYKVKRKSSDMDFMADNELKPESVSGTGTKSF